MSARRTVTICVPTLNEAEGLGSVLESVRGYADELVVVDGHSTDGTREVADGFGATVLLDNGLGKGDAIRVAIEAASTDLILFIDADGSHDPKDIPRLLEPLQAREADIVIGSRTRGGSEELSGDVEKFARMIGSDIITMSLNYRFGVSLTDSQNGFRAMTVEAARDLDLSEDITTIEQEMLLKALWRGHHIVEIPTREYAREHGVSKIRLRRVAPRYVWCLLKYLVVPGLPAGKKRSASRGTVEQRR
jgi:dolichol-phosphate mannosyltransferase